MIIIEDLNIWHNNLYIPDKNVDSFTSVTTMKIYQRTERFNLIAQSYSMVIKCVLFTCVYFIPWLIHSLFHYDDVIMDAIASQITSLTIVYSTIYTDVDQRKHQSSASLAFVWGIHRGPVNSPHKWPVTRKMFPFDDVIMYCNDSTGYILSFTLFILLAPVK